MIIFFLLDFIAWYDYVFASSYFWGTKLINRGNDHPHLYNSSHHQSILFSYYYLNCNDYWCDPLKSAETLLSSLLTFLPRVSYYHRPILPLFGNFIFLVHLISVSGVFHNGGYIVFHTDMEHLVNAFRVITFTNP